MRTKYGHLHILKSEMHKDIDIFEYEQGANLFVAVKNINGKNNKGEILLSRKNILYYMLKDKYPNVSIHSVRTEKKDGKLMTLVLTKYEVIKEIRKNIQEILIGEVSVFKYIPKEERNRQVG